jgi:hypothetical protein
MILPQFVVLRGNLSIVVTFVLVFCAQVPRADEPALRVAGDCFIPLVHVSPGEFEMGRASRGALVAAALSFGEQADSATQGPVRKVAISKPFLIGKYKITCEQFCEFLNAIDNPDQYVDINAFSWIEKCDGKFAPKGGKDTYPINVVHWDGARQFCQWLSETSGRKVRLPTEAEWEYVARGKEGRKVPWGNKDISAWASSDGAAVDAFPENATPEGVVGLSRDESRLVNHLAERGSSCQKCWNLWFSHRGRAGCERQSALNQAANRSLRCQAARAHSCDSSLACPVRIKWAQLTAADRSCQT